MPKLMWIVNVNPFPGYVQTHVSVEDDGSRHVAYTRHPTENRKLTPEEYLAQPEKQHLQLIDDAELDRLMTAYEWEKYLSQPVQEISQERFWEMLEVLPPMNWVGGDGFERFNMMERTSGNITSQYARLGDRYFHKHVDLTKPETFMTVESLAGL